MQPVYVLARTPKKKMAACARLAKKISHAFIIYTPPLHDLLLCVLPSSSLLAVWGCCFLLSTPPANSNSVCQFCVCAMPPPHLLSRLTVQRQQQQQQRQRQPATVQLISDYYYYYRLFRPLADGLPPLVAACLASFSKPAPVLFFMPPQRAPAPRRW